VAAGYAAQEFAGLNAGKSELAIITADSMIPYDRPPLSKAFLSGDKNPGDILINPESFYRERDIEVLTRQKVNAIRFDERKMRSEGGDEFRFEKLLIATGSEPRRLNLPGASLDGIHYLRQLRDSEEIREEMGAGRRAIVIGAGFIGMEVASVLARKGIDTTMVFPQERVWQSFFTPEMSAFFEGYFAERQVKFLPCQSVAAFAGTNRVKAVQLESGQELPADFVVAGIGAAPEVSLFEGTPLQISNGILVNQYLETSVPEVWAAGDVANFPDSIFEKRRRVEHWDNAVEQGRLAARNMLGHRAALRHVVYFFSDVFDLSYEFWGDTSDHDQIVSRGDMNRSSFSIWWLKHARLVAAFIMNRPDEERELAPKWIEQRLRLDADLLGDPSRPLQLQAAA
jgi:NADPH-dependent 2,4-dienoyl-CoA reductase/sulfur reductase-like enzyme